MPQALRPVRSAVLPPADLVQRGLLVSVQGMPREALQQTFDDARSAERVHDAIDIMAPRNTPVVAVEDGRIAKLFTSDLGGGGTVPQAGREMLSRSHRFVITSGACGFHETLRWGEYPDRPRNAWLLLRDHMHCV